MLTWADLASRDDFVVGPLAVSPSRRLLSGPDGDAHLEPRVLQVLICLLDADEGVVTRDMLLDQCWGGTPVGDDSINGAVGKLRRALDSVVPGIVDIETIPRTGYRLSGLKGAEAERPRSISRRSILIGAAAVGTVALGGVAVMKAQKDPEVEQWLRNADRKLRDQYPGSGLEAAGLVGQVLQREPENAEALGLLALAHRAMAEGGSRADVPGHIASGMEAADRALAIDPDEGNALTAKATLRPEFGNWSSVETRLRHALSRQPDNVHAAMYLTMLLQQVGRAEESERWNQRVIEIDPLTPVPQFRRGLKEWIFGRDDRAYLVIDRAFQTWPRHPAVWTSRLYIYTFTGRARDASAMLDEGVERPPGFGDALTDYFRVMVRAFDTQSSADRERARQELADLSSSALPFAITGIMGLSKLGFLDEAFAVADGAYLGTGPYRGKLWNDVGDPQVSDQYWARTMNLFTPAALPMRLDPRFEGLCDRMGLQRYWSATGTRPDEFLFQRSEVA